MEQESNEGAQYAISQADIQPKQGAMWDNQQDIKVSVVPGWYPATCHVGQQSRWVWSQADTRQGARWDNRQDTKGSVVLD